MPELPEVETARRGIAPHLVGRRIASLVIRNPRLRRPVPLHLQTELAGRRIEAVERRAKYLLLRCTGGTLLVHLGMSGHLRVFSEPPPPGSHDHLDLVLDDGSLLRYRDPRRFGLFLWTTAPPGQHPLLRHLGPEPFAPEFDGAWLYARSRGRTAAVKGFLMDQRTVVGVGNIYASDALFRAGIRPDRPAGRIGLARYRRLAETVRTVLGEAIDKGGTTLRDFSDASGEPGYFRLDLAVYGRAGAPCRSCGQALRQQVIAQRSSVYCPHCQR